MNNKIKTIISFTLFFYLLAFFHELGHFIGMMIFQEYIPTIFFIKDPLYFGWKMTMNNPPTIIGALFYYLVIPITLEIIIIVAMKKSYWWLLIISLFHGSDINQWLILVDCAIM